MCRHYPRCVSSDVAGRDSARTVAAHPEQGWRLLCNGVIAFDDGGLLLPDGSAVSAPAVARPGYRAGAFALALAS